MCGQLEVEVPAQSRTVNGGISVKASILTKSLFSSPHNVGSEQREMSLERCAHTRRKLFRADASAPGWGRGGSRPS